MSVTRSFVVYKFGISAAIVALLGAAVFAQEPGEEPDEAPADESEQIEEIIIIAPKPGDRRRLDPEYEDPVRAKLLKDFHEMQEDKEEFEWRKSAAAENSSRITWGYDPTEDYRMRNEMDLQALPSERTKPATLFKFEF